MIVISVALLFSIFTIVFFKQATRNDLEGGKND